MEPLPILGLVVLFPPALPSALIDGPGKIKIVMCCEWDVKLRRLLLLALLVVVVLLLARSECMDVYTQPIGYCFILFSYIIIVLLTLQSDRCAFSSGQTW